MRMAIFIKGGLIQDIVSDSEVDIVIIDGDTDGADSDEIETVLGDEGVISHRQADIVPTQVDTIWKQTLKA